MDVEEKDIGEHHDSPRAEHGRGADSDDEQQQHVIPSRELPADLPRTLDDRQNFSSYTQETEYYDAWQGA